MTPPLFLLDTASLQGESVQLSGREGHHAADVRRLRVGERADVSDGAGLRLQCRVESVSRASITLQVLARVVEPPARPRVEVAQALVKHDAADRALAGMTEVGVDAVIGWAAQRSIVTWDADRLERGMRRWRAAVAEAAKQCRRAWVPQVEGPLDTEGLAERVSAADVALLLDADAPDALGAVDLADVAGVLLVVGPEGGVSDDESTRLVAAGARRVHLGPTILRSSTAGTVGAAVLLSRTRRWAARAAEASAG